MKELGCDKVWTDEISSTQWVRGEVSAKIISPYLHNVVAIALRGSIGTGEEGIIAEVAQFNTLDDLKAAKLNSLNGKIAFVSYLVDKHITGNSYGTAVDTRVKGALITTEKGAIALITRSVGTDDNLYRPHRYYAL